MENEKTKIDESLVDITSIHDVGGHPVPPQGIIPRDTWKVAGNDGPDGESGPIGDSSDRAVISVDLLWLSATGRNLLAYIIKTKPVANSRDVVKPLVLDKTVITNYYATNYGKSYANTTNINRGIKELEKLKIIFHDPHVAELYWINKDKLNLLV
jgi:hypothetical protein